MRRVHGVQATNRRPLIRYLTGCYNAAALAAAHGRGVALGLMVQPRSALHERVGEFPYWAADNGAFTTVEGGFHAGRFRQLIARVELRANAASCLFVAAPDRVEVDAAGGVRGDAAGTLEQFPAWRAEIAAAGLPVALVAQDGLEHVLDRVPWPLVDVLFLGGSSDWKVSARARACALAAVRAGKRVHMGRVNSFSRLRCAASMLAESADGTFLKFGPNANVGRLCRWFDKLAGGVQVGMPWV